MTNDNIPVTYISKQLKTKLNSLHNISKSRNNILTRPFINNSLDANISCRTKVQKDKAFAYLDSINIAIVEDNVQNALYVKLLTEARANANIIYRATIIDTITEFEYDFQEGLFNHITRYLTNMNVIILDETIDNSAILDSIDKTVNYNSILNNTNVDEYNENDMFKLYLLSMDDNPNCLKLLSLEQEQELGRRIKAGDTEAFNILVESNLRLVISEARKYINSAMSFTDIIQAGNAGLLIAASKYNPDLGFKFSSYAVTWIKQSILATVNSESRLIRLPMHACQQALLIRKAIGILCNNNNHNYPSITEITDYVNNNNMINDKYMPTKLTKETAELLLKFFDFNLVSSLNCVLKSDDESEVTLENSIEDTTSMSLDTYIENIDLKNIFDTLLPMICTEKEIAVLSLRFGLIDGCARTLQEVGAELNFTKERARQIEFTALNKLRKSAKTKKILAGYF